jgi:hypothetical protein
VTIFDRYPDDLRYTRRALGTLEAYIEHTLMVLEYDLMNFEEEEYQQVRKEVLRLLAESIDKGYARWESDFATPPRKKKVDAVR